jgi:hypothetical protein
LTSVYLCFVDHGSGDRPLSGNEKMACGVVLRRDSRDLHNNRFFVGNKTGLLFHCWSLDVSFSIYECVFPVSDVGDRYSVRWCPSCRTGNSHSKASSKEFQSYSIRHTPVPFRSPPYTSRHHPQAFPSPVMARGARPRHFRPPPDGTSLISLPRPIPCRSRSTARSYHGQRESSSVHPIPISLTSQR